MSSIKSTTKKWPSPPTSIEDLTGRDFEHWHVLGYSHCDKYRHFYWQCRCVCGKEKAVAQRNLTPNLTRSCGCIRGAKTKTDGGGECDQSSRKREMHGMNDTHEYKCWCRMIQRCTNSKMREYMYWGGRGIKMWPEWRSSFAAFYAYIGPAPSEKHTLDRYPNNDGNYEPGNVRWATEAEQARNKRNNISLSVNGRTMILADWAKERGIAPTTIASRLKIGWSDEKAVLTPVRGGDDRKKRHSGKLVP